jgi:16S rRNA (uracil1498-N3)-methyltransferase
MRIARIFVTQALSAPAELDLDDASAHYLSHVLRVRPGAALCLFDGRGGEYRAELLSIYKDRVRVFVHSYEARESESHFKLTLIQGIAKPDHMDWVMQKAVELGVHHIVPLQCAFTQHFDPQRRSKRHEHWHKIIINACMQCGRNRVPQLSPVMSLDEWVQHEDSSCRCVLAPHGGHHLGALHPQNALSVLIGPEGGLNERELDLCTQAGYLNIRLGARILRTETAALAALAAAQTLWGDFNLP